MVWGRLLQLGKPLTRTPIAEFSPSWCRLFSSATETFVQASRVGGHESGAQVMRSSGDSFDAVVCGRGDKKTKRGKRFKGSFGNPRESRGTTTRRLRKKWELSYDPLVPDSTSCQVRLIQCRSICVTVRRHVSAERNREDQVLSALVGSGHNRRHCRKGREEPIVPLHESDLWLVVSGEDILEP